MLDFDDNKGAPSDLYSFWLHAAERNEPAIIQIASCFLEFRDPPQADFSTAVSCNQ